MCETIVEPTKRLNKKQRPGRPLVHNLVFESVLATRFLMGVRSAVYKFTVIPPAQDTPTSLFHLYQVIHPKSYGTSKLNPLSVVRTTVLTSKLQ